MAFPLNCITSRSYQPTTIKKKKKKIINQLQEPETIWKYSL